MMALVWSLFADWVPKSGLWESLANKRRFMVTCRELIELALQHQGVGQGQFDGFVNEGADCGRDGSMEQAKHRACSLNHGGDDIHSMGRPRRQRVLFVATVDSHIWYFHMPHMQLLRDMGYSVEVAAGASGFAEQVHAEGYEVHKIPFSRNPLSIRNIMACRALRRLMKRRHYVMVHAHTPVAGFLGRLAARRVGVPHVIYTAHGFHFHSRGTWWSNGLYYALERIAARWTDTLVTINREDCTIASRAFAHGRTKIVYVPGVGVDCRRYQPSSSDVRMAARAALGLPADAYMVAWVGELDWNKRPEDALAAIRYLSQTGRTRMLMLGSGEIGEVIGELVVRYGLTGVVSLTGRVSDMVGYLSASDVLLSTSVREGLPRSVMEAMATELPIVAYDIRGCNDLVVDGETGFLVPFGDVPGLADKLAWLAQHPDERHRMGEAGRRRIEQTFSLEAVLPRMKTVYEDELRRGRS
jgi:glycosyltransferase involved in cell wall biosynthesis